MRGKNQSIMTPTLHRKLNDISAYAFSSEEDHIKSITLGLALSFNQKDTIAKQAIHLIDKIKSNHGFSMEQFFNKYNLSTLEGTAIIALSECLIRIPDNRTSIELVKDKLMGKNWKKYLELPKIQIIEFASLGLYLSGKIATLLEVTKSSMFSKMSAPAFTAALKYAICVIGKEFVIGEYLDVAILKAKNKAKQSENVRYSFDLLGEGSRTFQQAEIYYDSYMVAIDKIAKYFPNDTSMHLKNRPNLSIKLTGLYPKFELLKLDDIKKYLVPKLVTMIKKMEANGISISFDAEESSRLDTYLEIITEIISHPTLSKFEGIGFVVQAYQKRSLKVIEYIVDLSKHLNKLIQIRLVKGAYWDSEIKNAQAYSLPDYPVFTHKEHTDANYIACAKYMLSEPNHIFSQFATHNAITAATIEEFAGDADFEFQKLYGMGKAMHKELLKKHAVRTYAPVGKMHDLLAYLMRRMLENGANNSFVHLVNKMNSANLVKSVYSDIIVLNNTSTELPMPYKIYKDRDTTIGFDLGDKMHIDFLTTNIAKFKDIIYNVGSIIDGKEILTERKALDRFRPGKYAEKIGSITYVAELEMNQAMEICNDYFVKWSIQPVADRAKILHKIADLFHKHEGEILSLLIREGGKSIKDAISEVHEAIDFCKYYAMQAEQLMQARIMPGITGERNTLSIEGRGVFLCISPWNFPLAIFTGQIVAALVVGNTVVAKAADQTSIMANYVVKLMHKAGIPTKALQLIIASGATVGRHICAHKSLAGVVFTGSNETAHTINVTLAQSSGAILPFIAETGGQNAMIVDSSALLEQVTDDVISSAFHSAGQRCSALRILYIQDEIYEPLKEMLIGAIDTLKIGDTIDMSNDIGPVIDKKAMDSLIAHINDMKERGFTLLTKHSHNGMAKDGYFFYPHIIEVNKISDIDGEKFGPILHIVRYKAKDLDKVIDEINNCGFGLTFGIHSRIETRIDYIKSRVRVGNIYANRSIIGAQVESQPFGGRGLSGTGFKAGGPHYLLRFITEKTTSINLTAIGGNIDLLG